MAKKISYNTKTLDELKTELTTLKGTLRTYTAKSFQGKNTKEYRTTRKNIARIMTALNSSSIK